MSNRELPMMPWFPDQFAAATSTWAFAERSAYRALLDVQWAIGTLPVDTWRLALAIGMKLEEFEVVWPVVRKKFQPVEGGIRNFRLEQHRLAAMRRKEGQRGGAQVTNARRRGERDGERSPSVAVSGTATDTLGGAPLSPSPSPIEDHPLPPQGGRHGQTANGGRKPRAERDRSLTGWREVTPVVDQVRDTAKLPSAKRLTWAYVGEHCVDKVAVRAAEAVGFKAIADRDKFTTTDVQARFREAYERIANAEHTAEAPAARPHA